MKIKKFSSRTVPSALAKVRAEFGDDAVILSTKRSEVDPTQFDVVAAMDLPGEPMPPSFPRVDREGRPVDPAPEPGGDPERSLAGGIGPAAAPLRSASAAAQPVAKALDASRISLMSDEAALPPVGPAGAGAPGTPEAADLSGADSGAAASFDRVIAGDELESLVAPPPPGPATAPAPDEAVVAPRDEEGDLETAIFAIDSISEAIEPSGGVADDPVPVDAGDTDARPPRDRAQLLDEIQGLRNRLETVAGLLQSGSPADLPEKSRRMHLRLIETGLDARVATAVLRRAEKIDVPLERAVHHILSAAIRTGGAIPRGLGRQTIAFVGATGVGKTTTIAKIASRLALEEKRRVALISADAFRVGGADQLAFYADILEIPFHAVSDRDSLSRALELTQDAEVVLVDTTGRGSADASGVDEVGAMLEADPRLHRWLVLSAVAATIDNLAALRAFARLRPSGVIVTKVDEAAAHGAAATVLIRSALPLRYLSDGQAVPDDLVTASRDTFPELLLEGSAR